MLCSLLAAAVVVAAQDPLAPHRHRHPAGYYHSAHGGIFVWWFIVVFLGILVCLCTGAGVQHWRKVVTIKNKDGEVESVKETEFTVTGAKKKEPKFCV